MVLIALKLTRCFIFIDCLKKVQESCGVVLAPSQMAQGGFQLRLNAWVQLLQIVGRGLLDADIRR